MKRIALRVLLVSVAVSALFGIYVLVFGDAGSFETKVFLTSLVVTGASILTMCCAAAWEARRLGFAPPAGVAAALCSALLALVMMWAETIAGKLPELTGTLTIVAVLVAHAGLLALAKLDARGAAVRVATYASATVLAGLLVAAVWIGDLQSEAFWRTVGVLSILVAAGTVAVPVFARLGAAARDEVRLRHCPSCGAALAQSPCPRCGALFSVAFGEA